MSPWEIQAYIANVLGDMENAYSNSELQYADLPYQKIKNLYKISELFRTFFNIRETFRYIVDNARYAFKDTFAKRYIRDWYSQNFPHPIGFIYDMDFSVDRKYNDKSFDKFFSFHLQYLDLFVDECCEMYGDLFVETSVNENLERKRKGWGCVILFTQNDFQKLRMYRRNKATDRD